MSHISVTILNLICRIFLYKTTDGDDNDDKASTLIVPMVSLGKKPKLVKDDILKVAF